MSLLGKILPYDERTERVQLPSGEWVGREVIEAKMRGWGVRPVPLSELAMPRWVTRERLPDPVLCDVCRLGPACLHVSHGDGVYVSTCHGCKPGEVVRVPREAWWLRALRWLERL